MRLKLTLRREGDVRTDLDVTADASATVGDLARTLFLADPAHAGAAAPGPLTLHVAEGGGRSLQPDAGVLEAGLRSGSTITVVQHSDRFVAADGSRGTPAAVLRVLSGPDAGQDLAVPSGSSVLGRERDVDVRLSDPLVSKRHVRINVGETVELVDLASANGVLVGGRPVTRHTVAPGEVVTLGDTELTVIPLRGTSGAEPTSAEVPVNRSPRVVPRFEVREVPAPEPPKRNQRSRFPVLTVLAPVLLGAVMFLFTHSP
ncbi:MAG: hypothetical protein B7X41_03730, partial [Microbacterium sp. 14-71-5]